jgi:hypothetical protein
MIGQHFLDDTSVQLRKLKTLADKAIAQTKDEHFFRLLDAEANSIALLMKHMAGNMRSRWTDFLTSDGEKPNRERDREFVHETETRAAIQSVWEDGWALLFRTIDSLKEDDLGKTVRVRGEAHTVLEAINRQMTHYAQHVGQIVLLAKHYAGASWTSLSIPRGKSKEIDVAKSGHPHGI